MPVETIEVDAILFDMDGTLVDSTAGVVGAWNTFAEAYPGIDVHHILNTAHGVRTVENLRNYCGITDPDLLEREAVRFEQAIIDCSAKDGQQGIVMLPGVQALLDELAPARHLPRPRWAICTSATRAYATAALAITRVPLPDVFVAAEDVAQGKPAPDPYLLGAARCGVRPERCLVFEDAPSGIRSGAAAGCHTLGVVTSHTREQLEAVKPTYLVDKLTDVSVKLTATGVQVTMKTF